MLQAAALCLSSDVPAQALSEWVSVLTAVTDHEKLAKQLCCQHGEPLAAPYPSVVWHHIHHMVFVARWLCVHSLTYLVKGLVNLLFFRAVCFLEVVPVHQNPTRQPTSSHGLDSAASAGNICEH